jgi:hypothetical protein
MTTIVNDVSDVGIYNIVADQGTTFMRSITYKNAAGTAINLGTGASAQMKVRKSYPSTQNRAAYRDTAVLWLGTSGAGATTTALTLTPASGIIDIKIPAATMAGPAAGIYDYDLEVTLGTSPGVGASGDVIKIIRGLFEVRQEITY